MPTAGSLFSGAGGFDLGFEAAGFEVAWQVEIDRACVSVLERHWPGVPRWGDVSEVDPAELAPVDVVIFGSPCQDFSVAGKRTGLEGARSGLFGEAIRIIRGLRPTPAFCVWENVPGALSSARGRDFGAVLDALADIGALDIAWRVLDARYWGVPQRRRRIFLVADFGAERAGQVLFESEGGSGDSEACGAAGEGLAGDVEDGAGVACIKGAAIGRAPHAGPQRGEVLMDGSVYTLNCTEVHAVVMPPVAAEAGNRTSGPLDVAIACNAHGGPHGRQDFESETFIVASSVAGQGGKPGQGYQAVREGMAVRRLTPRECERLQGWPDSHTEFRADGSLIPDGRRYRMIGNGVASPVAAWIARRMLAALEG